MAKTDPGSIDSKLAMSLDDLIQKGRTEHPGGAKTMNGVHITKTSVGGPMRRPPTKPGMRLQATQSSYISPGAFVPVPNNNYPMIYTVKVNGLPTDATPEELEGMVKSHFGKLGKVVRFNSRGSGVGFVGFEQPAACTAALTELQDTKIRGCVISLEAGNPIRSPIYNVGRAVGRPPMGGMAGGQTAVGGVMRGGVMSGGMPMGPILYYPHGGPMGNAGMGYGGYYNPSHQPSGGPGASGPPVLASSSMMSQQQITCGPGIMSGVQTVGPSVARQPYPNSSGIVGSAPTSYATNNSYGSTPNTASPPHVYSSVPSLNNTYEGTNRSSTGGPKGSITPGYHGSVVLVSNVPFDLTATELQGAFSVVGTVVRTEVLLYSNGSHSGRVAVLYNTPQAADEAVRRFDGGDLNGQTIRVFLE